MSKSCEGLLKEFARCLLESDCVKDGRPYKECAKLGEGEGVSPECVGIRMTYFRCKRGQLDMTTRIRGNKGY
ncbi:hypothetical protein KFL_004500040 [Klebsormidium nitens]|uniref:Cytochrome c oxidase assembly factor 5 n=1 Tax=Klebsormidium nitens TaxID=105231 RepID=A0A1Y1ICH1_KLENI|nr:hypothetical protein KFL_004500040 [Klebsormidium nitens]|eukprot:GAQ88664.1 hypothetical protein KFL_004500040 [Klebsormidium nitens]